MSLTVMHYVFTINGYKLILIEMRQMYFDEKYQ